MGDKPSVKMRFIIIIIMFIFVLTSVFISCDRRRIEWRVFNYKRDNINRKEVVIFKKSISKWNRSLKNWEFVSYGPPVGYSDQESDGLRNNHYCKVVWNSDHVRFSPFVYRGRSWRQPKSPPELIVGRGMELPTNDEKWKSFIMGNENCYVFYNFEDGKWVQKYAYCKEPNIKWEVVGHEYDELMRRKIKIRYGQWKPNEGKLTLENFRYEIFPDQDSKGEEEKYCLVEWMNEYVKHTLWEYKEDSWFRAEMDETGNIIPEILIPRGILLPVNCKDGDSYIIGNEGEYYFYHCINGNWELVCHYSPPSKPYETWTVVDHTEREVKIRHGKWKLMDSNEWELISYSDKVYNQDPDNPRGESACQVILDDSKNKFRYIVWRKDKNEWVRSEIPEREVPILSSLPTGGCTEMTNPSCIVWREDKQTFYYCDGGTWTEKSSINLKSFFGRFGEQMRKRWNKILEVFR